MKLDGLARNAVRELREAGQQARFTARPPAATRSVRGRPTRWPAWAYLATGFAVAVAVGAATWAVLESRQSTPPVSPETTTSAFDRWGLAGVALPGTAEEIGLVFEAMPPEVDGQPGGGTGGDHIVTYGEAGTEGSSLFASGSDQLMGLGGEPVSPAEAVAQMATGEESEIIARDLEGDTVWLHGARLGGDGTEYFLVWGEADGEWLFTFDAWSQEDLDALVAAFITTSRTVLAGASPTTEPSAAPTTTLLEETITSEVPTMSATLADAHGTTVTEYLHVLAPTREEVAEVFGIESIEGTSWTGPGVIPIADWQQVPAIVGTEYSERRDGGVPESFVQLMAYDTPEEAAAGLALLLESPPLFGPGSDRSTVKSTFVVSGFEESAGHVLDGTMVLRDYREPDPEDPNPRPTLDMTLVLGRIDRVVAAVGMIASTDVPTEGVATDLAEIIPGRADRFNELLDVSQLSPGLQPPILLSVKPIDFDLLGASMWSFDGWTILPLDPWTREIERDGEGQFMLTLEPFPWPAQITELVASGSSEGEALVELVDEFAADLMADWSSQGMETFSEIAELDVAERPAVRVLVGAAMDDELWNAHLSTFFVARVNLVIVYVDQAFQDIDPNLLVEFAPVLDRYLEALPILE